MFKMFQAGNAALALSLVFTYAAIHAGNAQDTQDAQRRALQLISETADRICSVVSTRGESQSSQVQGNIQAQLSGLASKLASAGVSASGSITNSQYQNVLREQLAEVLRDNAACRLKVLEMLRDKLLGTASHTGAGDAANLGLTGPQSAAAATPRRPRITPHPSSIGGIGLGARFSEVQARPGVRVAKDGNGNAYAVMTPVRLTFGRGPSALAIPNAEATFDLSSGVVGEITIVFYFPTGACDRSLEAGLIVSTTAEDWGPPVEGPVTLPMQAPFSSPRPGETWFGKTALRYAKDDVGLIIVGATVFAQSAMNCHITLIYSRASSPHNR